jgi:hypothetical protein
MRMLETGRGPGLVLKAGQRPLVEQFHERQHLQRHAAAQ